MINVKECTFEQLVEYLNEIEEVKPRVRNTSSGYEIIIETTPDSGEFVEFSNLEMLCQWAAAHEYSIYMLLGRMAGEASLSIYLSTLYGDNK